MLKPVKAAAAISGIDYIYRPHREQKVGVRFKM